MKPATKLEKIEIKGYHWRVPSVERAFEGWLVGKPTEEQRRQRTEEVLRKRAAWKPNEEAMQAVKRLRGYLGCRLRIQFWDHIMNWLEEEGPFPLEADCKDVVILQEGEFPQAYLVIDNILEIPTPEGYSPQRHFLKNREGIPGQLAPLAEFCEIWRVVPAHWKEVGLTTGSPASSLDGTQWNPGNPCIDHPGIRDAASGLLADASSD